VSQVARRLAVTGANGFVGRHVLAAAVERGLRPLGIVRSPQAERVVRGLGAEVARVTGLTAPELVSALQQAEAVVHLAQIGAERGADRYELVNEAGTRAVIAAARAADVPRVVFLSGLGVGRYGAEPRCTNRYFLSKLTAEVDLYRSGLDVVVLRPSYVLGAGGELVPTLLAELEQGEVEEVGDGSHRMQPIAAADAAAAILAATRCPVSRPRVVDLVGPEAISYRELVERVAAVAARLGTTPRYRLRTVSAEQADRRAREGGYRGMLPDELDCLLCDEVASPQPLVELLGRALQPLDQALAAAVEAASGPLAR
jgi:nucleoside-diphosphate-sugar epimerase